MTCRYQYLPQFLNTFQKSWTLHPTQATTNHFKIKWSDINLPTNYIPLQLHIYTEPPISQKFPILNATEIRQINLQIQPNIPCQIHFLITYYPITETENVKEFMWERFPPVSPV